MDIQVTLKKFTWFEMTKRVLSYSFYIANFNTLNFFKIPDNSKA